MEGGGGKKEGKEAEKWANWAAKRNSIAWLTVHPCGYSLEKFQAQKSQNRTGRLKYQQCLAIPLYFNFILTLQKKKILQEKKELNYDLIKKNVNSNLKTKGDVICCVVTQHSSWIWNAPAAVPPLLKVQPDVSQFSLSSCWNYKVSFSSPVRMGVTRLPNLSRILCFSFHIILILLQQTTAARELKFVVVVSRFALCFVVGNTGTELHVCWIRQGAQFLCLCSNLEISTAALLLIEFKDLI